MTEVNLTRSLGETIACGWSLWFKSDMRPNGNEGWHASLRLTSAGSPGASVRWPGFGYSSMTAATKDWVGDGEPLFQAPDFTKGINGLAMARASSKVTNRLLDAFLAKHGFPIFKTVYERSRVSLKDATTLNTTFVVHGTMAPLVVNQEDVKRINVAVAISSGVKFIRPALRTELNIPKRKEPDSPFDVVRSKAVRCLSQLMGDDGKARVLEMSIWGECLKTGVDYMARIRTITFSLKNPGNVLLIAGVSRGEVDGAQLVNMTPDDLSSKAAVARQAAAEKSLKHMAKLPNRKVVWTGSFSGHVQALIEICSPDASTPPIHAPELVFETDTLLSAETLVARALGGHSSTRSASLAVARGSGVVALGMFLYGSNLVARSDTPLVGGGKAEFYIFPRGAFSSSRKQLGASELLAAIVMTTAPRPPPSDPRVKHAARPRAAWAPWYDNSTKVLQMSSMMKSQLTPTWASLASF